MYILTSKYFPTDSWPDDYFPALPEGVVDIQYKEVVEFSLAIAATAEFEVVLPNDASVDVGTSGDMIVSWAGSTVVNDTWTFWDTVDGKPAYITATEYMAWTATAGFWSMSGWYISYDDVATPDLCTTWETGYGGVLPLPTVTAGGSATLTEVAAFTVEMPQVITMEVYEELSA